MQPDEMCKTCKHKYYCIGAFIKNVWCGNYTSEKRLKKIIKDEKVSKKI